MGAEIRLPYGRKTLQPALPTERVTQVIKSRIESYAPAGDPDSLIEEAMRHPIGSPRLCELAKGKQNVVILASDHTRPVPSRLIIPPMLREIREGAPDAKVTILVATGCHRETSKEELREKFGEEIFFSEEIVVHDCDRSPTVRLGTLPSGQELAINRIASEADLLVAEGFIEPHFFAGYSGGRKSVLPGIAAREVVLGNHNGAFIADPCSRTGILEGNPIHRDMIFAARAAKLSYIVNVVLNGAHEVIYAVAGDCEEAHEQGCAFLASHCGMEAESADIVITTNGGYPLDQNVYQSVKGMTAAESVVREGGVIIMLSACNDGTGGDSFYHHFKDHEDLRALLREFEETPAQNTQVDQWQSQILARVLTKASVIFISEMPDEIVRDFHMIPAKTVEEALAIADGLLGTTDGTIAVIPDGVSVYFPKP